MGNVVFALAIAGPPLVGLAAPRAWALILPFATVPTFYLGLLAGWWGSGVGDGWEGAFALCLAGAVAATVAAVGLRILVRRR